MLPPDLASLGIARTEPAGKAATPTASDRVEPCFETSECAVKLASGEWVERGMLYVPENRRKARR